MYLYYIVLHGFTLDSNCVLMISKYTVLAKNHVYSSKFKGKARNLPVLLPG